MTAPRVTAVDAAQDPSGSPSLRRLARAEALRLTAYRTTRCLLYVLPLIVIAYGASRLFIHDTDVAAAWREANDDYQKFLPGAERSGLNASSVTAANFYDEPRYMMAKEAFVDLRTVLSGIAAAALGLGIIAGGADWSSRVMLTLTAAEPRRGRLFATRALTVAALAAAVATVAGAILLPLLMVAGRWKGSLAGLDTRFWSVLTGQFLRGIVLVALMALLGYALAMATRRTSAALALVFVYLAFAEQFIKDYAPSLDEHHIQGLTFAVLNDKPVIPLADSDCFAGPGCEAIHVDLTQADGFLGLLVYLAPVLALAAWRYTRTDVG